MDLEEEGEHEEEEEQGAMFFLFLLFHILVSFIWFLPVSMTESHNPNTWDSYYLKKSEL